MPAVGAGAAVAYLALGEDAVSGFAALVDGEGVEGNAQQLDLAADP